MNITRSWIPVVLALFALVAPSPARAPASAAAAARPGPDAVWVPGAGAIDRAQQELERGQPIQAALEIAMRAVQARPAALAFSRRLGDLGGYMGSFVATGPLITGMLYYPLRAHENAEPFVIDAANRLVRPAVDDQVRPAEMAAHPGYKHLRPSGELAAWPPQERFEQRAGADGGLALVYAYPMRACHACPLEGVARVAYRFDPAGKYLVRQLLEVEPPPPPPPPPASPAPGRSPGR